MCDPGRLPGRGCGEWALKEVEAAERAKGREGPSGWPLGWVR